MEPTQDTRTLSSEAKEALRMRAIEAVLKGKKQMEVAETLGVTRQAVGRWWKTYQESGFKGLKAKKVGRRKGGKLHPWQAAQTAKIVIDRHPEQVKLPWALWTREAVGDLILDKFNIRLSRWTVGRYLKRWGFTPQKPIRKAYEKDPEAVKKWLNEEYPEIRKKAKEDDAEIFWGDETGLRSAHFVGTSYGKKGQTPEVLSTGRRFGCNMISAITNQGKLNFMIYREKFESSVFIDFMRRLIRQHPKKVFLIVDNHSAHKSQKTMDWLKTHSQKISVFYLPSYSPELNPDELLNQDLKSNYQKKGRAKNKDELIGKTRSFMRKKQKQPDVVKRYFLGKHVQYAG